MSIRTVGFPNGRCWRDTAKPTRHCENRGSSGWDRHISNRKIRFCRISRNSFFTTERFITIPKNSRLKEKLVNEGLIYINSLRIPFVDITEITLLMVHKKPREIGLSPKHGKLANSLTAKIIKYSLKPNGNLYAKRKRTRGEQHQFHFYCYTPAFHTRCSLSSQPYTCTWLISHYNPLGFIQNVDILRFPTVILRWIIGAKVVAQPP